MKGRVIATILYEDQRGPTQGFGLHTFIVACVFDRVGGERWQLEKALDGRPLKGDSNLLGRIREDAPSIAADGRHIVAVFDDDKIRSLVKLAPTAEAAAVRLAILRDCKLPPESMRVFLVEENTESVLEAIGACKADLSRDLLARALRKKHIQRDAVFREAAVLRDRPVRDGVLTRVPSLCELVEHLTDLVRDEILRKPE